MKKGAPNIWEFQRLRCSLDLGVLIFSRKSSQ